MNRVFAVLGALAAYQLLLFAVTVACLGDDLTTLHHGDYQVAVRAADVISVEPLHGGAQVYFSRHQGRLIYIEGDTEHNLIAVREGLLNGNLVKVEDAAALVTLRQAEGGRYQLVVLMPVAEVLAQLQTVTYTQQGTVIISGPPTTPPTPSTTVKPDSSVIKPDSSL
jgi:hypothetical protein